MNSYNLNALFHTFLHDLHNLRMVAIEIPQKTDDGETRY
jgi:hypothetical protein